MKKRRIVDLSGDLVGETPKVSRRSIRVSQALVHRVIGRRQVARGWLYR